MKFALSVVIALLNSFILPGQSNKKHISLKDSIDGKFDLSDYIIDANGFIPIPLIITEPALGGFGLVEVIIVFLHVTGWFGFCAKKIFRFRPVFIISIEFSFNSPTLPVSDYGF